MNLLAMTTLKQTAEKLNEMGALSAVKAGYNGHEFSIAVASGQSNDFIREMYALGEHLKVAISLAPQDIQADIKDSIGGMLNE